MAQEWLERDDLSVYVVAGAPKGFNRSLRAHLVQEVGEDTETLRVKDELSEWVLAQVKGEYRREAQKSPASKALWRAFRALAAARYHLRGDEEREATLRDLRDRVEACWMETSPMMRNGGGEDDEEEEA
jgi:broad specificity phosphatase PhoE